MYIEDSIIQEQSYMLLSYFSHSFTYFSKFSIEFGQFSDLKIDKIVKMWGNIKDYNQLDEYPNLIIFKGYIKSDNPLNYQIVLIENKLIVNQETLHNDYLNVQFNNLIIQNKQ
ncbi:hypothetical protein PPERSA_00587 [Pseudocohnilembus persalinus]|uniref:Uncharacterized protein n=1 Tax=Pseudocohnilembus persalinus TaxID=266149 RepID=A0A0V0QSQ5_PSEPJ|nr:hypothetical protein PPERSA_00587 [Pseudocohnilembus persalinus]|eukprot:KRX05286.1 hypothetical protein PPERSA_00587 [Pseudocohnilembus persalinus]